MLTKEIEGSMVKCGAYWADVFGNSPGMAKERTFGPLILKLVGKVGLPGGVDLMHEDEEGLRRLGLVGLEVGRVV